MSRHFKQQHIIEQKKQLHSKPIKLLFTDSVLGRQRLGAKFRPNFTPKTMYSENPYIFPANAKATNLPCF